MRIDAGLCVLRPWRFADLERLVLLADNAKIACRLRDRFPHPYTRAIGEMYLTLAQDMPPNQSFAIEVEHQLAGGIGLTAGDDMERIGAEVGYWLGEPYWGRGIATAALRAFAENAFTAFELERLFAKVFTDHPASARVLEKAGFVREGILRRSAIKLGVVRDMALYARLRIDSVASF